MVHFFYILDTIRANATTLYALKHDLPMKKVKSFDVAWDLVLSLVKPQIESRPTVGLSTNLVTKMSIILGRDVRQPRNNNNGDGE